ncbi:MAG: hypothetical protein LJE74_02405 [Proteobacteria bacterium]|nr:hypothetical protein [Pseudomonadota bacterium]
MWKNLWWVGLLSLVLIGTAQAAEGMKQDNQHVKTWNAFADKIYQLHRQLTADGAITVKKSLGGYAGNPEFYQQEEYYRAGRLVSRVQWERENPEQLHTIEVYIYDGQGRVARDFVAAYLPTYHNAPTQTLISLHRYNGDLHAFRSFDASGYRIIERCNGKLNGKDVNILLDEDEIADAVNDPKGVMQTDVYRQCFGDLQEKAGKYLNPQ